jgi:hypothetical protein
MSTSELRDSFNQVSEPFGIRCVAVRMSYCDHEGGAKKRDHQKLEFDIVSATDNSARTLMSVPLHGQTNLPAEVRDIALKTIEGKM